MNALIGGVGLRVFARVLAIPKPVILPALVFLCLVGSYLNDQSFFAVSLTVAFALFGYVMRKLGFPFVTFIIGFVLTPMLELSVSQAYILMDGEIASLIDYPVAFALVVLTAIVIVRAVVRGNRSLRLA